MVLISCPQRLEDLPVKPVIKIELQILNSYLWKTAYTNINLVQFCELAGDHNGSAYGMVENRDDILPKFNLEKESVQGVLEKPY